MDQHIVARARELVSAENSRFEDVVRNLEESRQSLEQERKEAQELSAQLSSTARKRNSGRKSFAGIRRRSWKRPE